MTHLRILKKALIHELHKLSDIHRERDLTQKEKDFFMAMEENYGLHVRKISKTLRDEEKLEVLTFSLNVLAKRQSLGIEHRTKLEPGEIQIIEDPRYFNHNQTPKEFTGRMARFCVRK